MAWWKQLAICIVLLLVAAGVAIRFVPGTSQALAALGIDVPAQLAAPQEDVAQAGQGPQRRGGGQGGSGLVTVEAVEMATINDRLQAIGTGRAIETVTVTPAVSGRLVEIAVRSGDRVAAQDAIARLDSEAEEIAVDRARLTLEDARARLGRIESLRQSNTATEVQLNEVQLAVRNAELALRDAELALERRSILAPIDGIVGILPVSTGNLVTEQTQITSIDDRSRILIDFWVPERFATMIDVGMPVAANTVARAGEAFEGTVSAIDNRIDAASRTLQVQAAVANDNDALRAGMSFQVEMRFPGDQYPSVDPLAIQWDSQGSFVWQVRDGAAERVPVRIVQRNSDSVLVSGNLASDVNVVTEGIHNVREGAPLNIATREPAPIPTAETDPAAVSAATGS